MGCVRRLQLECLLYLTLITMLSPAAFVASTTLNVLPQPDCPHKCGNITIPYPFGTRPECRRDGFDITCNESTTPPKAFLGSSNIEIINISITSGEVRVYKHIGYCCYNQSNNIYRSNSHAAKSIIPPFLFSNRRNKFTAIGCDTLAYIMAPQKQSHDQPYISGCVSYCESLNDTTGDGGLCNGLGCCQTTIPEGLNHYQVGWGYKTNRAWAFNPCSYAVLVEKDWYKFQVQDLSGQNFLHRTDQQRVPFVLDWAIRDNGTCLDSDTEKRPHSVCLSENSRCYNTTNGDGYICNCTQGYEGNPYISGGCIDIDECKFPDKYSCHGNCRNTNGSYECSCRKGTRGNATIGNCTKDPEKFPYPARVAISCIFCIVVLLGACFLLVWYQQHRRYLKEKEEYKRYYQMMDNHLHVFSKRQIENATNNYEETHILGRGGQGNVYKGLLENNQDVAIKKAKEVEETQRGEFVNEIILLSQINHKNVVRLLGCCLEVKIPMLVYEFVPNGTLFDLLHRKNSRRSISLDTRLKIALDLAVALDYLHSSITRSIIHGDVKSANVLLDVDYTAKVSDFGASSVVPVNEIVELVHFSHGYLDPECLYTHIITKNSDVFSFGVVMLELITRKAAIYTDENGGKQSLATCFLSKARKNEHRGMLDVEIATNEENVMEVLDKICEIALQCLSPKGEDRPTMGQVVLELQKLVTFYNSSASKLIKKGRRACSVKQNFPLYQMDMILIVPNTVRCWKSTPEHRGDVD